jgi:hypothetical protein
MATTFRVADVIRSCWESYNRAHALPPHVVKAMRHILCCRTAALGGHLHQCDQCGSEVPVYNSCQTRHCPTCQTAAKEEWLDARLTEVLPVQYFHVVFTLPHLLNALIDANRPRLLGELFGSINWVLQHFAQDPQWRLEGQLGFLAILHTWTQRLMPHFHVHCIVPGGVWRKDFEQWVPAHGQWLFHEASLRKAFRNRFLQRLTSLRKGAKLSYKGQAEYLSADSAWQQWIAALKKQKWIVFPKPTPPDPTQAFEYIARYTHKVAICDSRIKAIGNGLVTYSWRDRSKGNVERMDTIPVEDFTQRFAIHILPDGFHKIRYFGWMASVHRKKLLAAIRTAIPAEAPPSPIKETLAERVLRRTGVDITLCPYCNKGHLKRTDRVIDLHRGQSP